MTRSVTRSLFMHVPCTRQTLLSGTDTGLTLQGFIKSDWVNTPESVGVEVQYVIGELADLF